MGDGLRSPRGGKLRGFAGLLGILLAIVLARALLHQPPPEPPAWVRTPNATTFDVDFADPRNGFAVRGRCLRYWHDECRTTLLATRDGMRWEQRQIRPDVDGRLRLVGEVIALGPCRVALVAYDGSRLFSADCGRTWREVALAPQGTVAAIPAGGMLESSCFRQRIYPGGCPAARLLVTMPDGGRKWLAASPGLTRPRVDAGGPVNGGWWVAGTHPESGQLALAVSTDAGRTWSVRTLPEPQGDPFDELSLPPRMHITARGPAVYATVVGHVRRSAYDLLAIFVSDDHGASWRQTWRVTGDDDRRTIGGVVIPTGAEQLTVVDAGAKPYRSEDSGHSFRPWRLDRPIAWPRWTRGGYVARSSTYPVTWYRSPDGITWEAMALPAA